MSKTAELMSVFDRYRMPDSNISKWHEGGREQLASRIEHFVANNFEIKFLMLGYPFKSPNHIHKTLGPAPDLAEEVSFNNIKSFGQEVSKLHAPGMQLTILSDGFMFNDIFGVDCYNVDLYHDSVSGMIKDIKAPIDLLTLTDIYPELNVASAVDHMTAHFGLSEPEVERRILFEPNVNWLYRAFIRFMEEELANRTFSSKTQRHIEAKKRARAMMTRNEVYSNYAETEMSGHIRLSMHATTNDHKYGFQLVPGNNAKHSPWHCALAVSPTGFATIHKSDAEAAGYHLVSQHHQPYYYETV